jgi:hypothetical protein
MACAWDHMGYGGRSRSEAVACGLWSGVARGRRGGGGQEGGAGSPWKLGARAQAGSWELDRLSVCFLLIAIRTTACGSP